MGFNAGMELVLMLAYDVMGTSTVHIVLTNLTVNTVNNLKPILNEYKWNMLRLLGIICKMLLTETILKIQQHLIR